jgi:hypothetical protein
VADFDPRQLDSLEDALDGLDDLDDLESLGLEPALTERLAEYQDVLALCRQVFPPELPREDLLAEVLAEAAAVSRRPELREAEAGPWRRFWGRWRSTLIPGLALAGTAAAILWVAEPGRSSEQLAARADKTHDSDDTKRSDEERSADSTPSEPASDPLVDGLDDAAEPPETPELVVDSDGGPPPLAGAVEPSPSASASKKTRSKPAPSVAPSKPAPAPLSKDETWTVLERANADRRKGDCDRARSRYEDVIAASSDSAAIARAKAGIGLCLEQDLRDAEAAGWFEDARTHNAGIYSWINDQRDEQPLPGEKKKSKASNVSDALDSL